MKAIGSKPPSAKSLLNAIGEPLIVLDEAMQVVLAGRSFYRLFGASPAGTIGRTLFDSDAGHLDVPALRAFLDRVKRGGSDHRCEIEIDLPALGKRILVVRAAEIRDGRGRGRRTLLTLRDVTDYRRSGQQLAEATQAAEQANLAKSRFLAAVSHDLRQPLQTLTFLHGALRSVRTDEKSLELLGRAEETLGSMSGMAHALLDINQLEAGAMHAERIDFPINDLIGKLDSEYGLHAQTRGLGWRVVPCGLTVRSDPRLLEQMLRNLLSNALRYTPEGKVLLGCRRRSERLLIEVWDTGIGIAEGEIPNIFEEYHRATSATDGGSLGLGLAIVRRLGELLGHPIRVRSQLGKGSVFTIEVPLARAAPAAIPPATPAARPGGLPRCAAVLVIEDAATVREALERTLAREGHRVAAAMNGPAALALLKGSTFRPDIIVSDYVLPGGMNGVQAITAVHAALGRKVPVVFLTGDIRTSSLHDIEATGNIRLLKPVKPDELSRAIQQLLAAAPAGEEAEAAAPAAPANAGEVATIFVVDDDRALRESMRELLATAGYRVETFASGEAFLAADRADAKGCLVVDVRMPGINGFELLARLAGKKNAFPAILVTGHGDVAMGVQAMKAGAADFIEKPARPEQVIAAIDRALQHAATPAERAIWHDAAALRIAGLTQREREVMELVVAGHANKEIAARLRIARRTVENHRAKVMQKMGAASLSELVRLALAAGDRTSGLAADRQ
jgi:two-component system CheB/CheR fusion protein